MQIVFFSNFKKIFKGVFVANLISLLSNLILARIYYPEHFAIFSLFSQIITFLLITSGANIFLIILKKERIYYNTNYLIIVLLFSIINLIIFYFINSYFSLININYWLIIFGLLLSITYSFVHTVCISCDKYEETGKVKVIEKIFGNIANIVFGIFLSNKFGLILGNFFGQVIFIFKLKLIKKIKIDEVLSFDGYVKLINDRKKFIITQSISHLIEVTFFLSFSVLIAQKITIKELGYFYLVLRIVSNPLNIIADYLSQLSLSRISDFVDNNDKTKFVFKFLIVLIILTFSIVLIMLFFGSSIFLFVFGIKWVYSGIIAENFSLALGSIFIFRSIQYLLNSIDKQHIHTIFSVFFYSLPVTFMFLYHEFGSDFLYTLRLSSYSLLFTLSIYILFLLIIFSNTSQKNSF